MKAILLLSLLILISCSGEQPKEEPSTGMLRRYEPLTVGFEETSLIEDICQALGNKEDMLSILINTGDEYKFSYAHKGCEDARLTTPKDVTVTIQKPNSEYVFKAKDNAAFAFTEVETETKGVMANICKNLANLESPMQTSSRGAIWFTTATTRENCVSDANGTCIQIQRGTLVEGLDYLIHTSEWIKFKITNPRRGFFTERKLSSTANCEDEKTIERTAILK